MSTDRARDPESLFQMGLVYLEGIGVQPDPTQAAIWFKLAAKNGHAGARMQLAEMLQKGQYVPGLAGRVRAPS